MARTTKASTKAAVLEDENTDVEAAEPTTKQTINAGIAQVAEQLGVEAKNRYKVQRAIGFIAMQQAIEAGTFDELLDATIAGAADLPSGFELERTVAEKPAKAPAKAKAAAKPAPAKRTAKAAATEAAPKRRRPQR